MIKYKGERYVYSIYGIPIMVFQNYTVNVNRWVNLKGEL